jgi:hypothetical protein
LPRRLFLIVGAELFAEDAAGAGRRVGVSVLAVALLVAGAVPRRRSPRLSLQPAIILGLRPLLRASLDDALGRAESLGDRDEVDDLGNAGLSS